MAAGLRGRTLLPGWLTLTRGQPPRLRLNGPRCCSSAQRMWALTATPHREKVSGRSRRRVTATPTHWWGQNPHSKMPSEGKGVGKLNSISTLFWFQQMNMLMRLKEAATSSSPQSYDSDSNSNSHQDDILDSSLESTLWCHGGTKRRIAFYSRNSTHEQFSAWELIHTTKSSHLNLGAGHPNIKKIK